jgi:hypothetical protein
LVDLSRQNFHQRNLANDRPGQTPRTIDKERLITPCGITVGHHKVATGIFKKALHFPENEPWAQACLEFKTDQKDVGRDLLDSVNEFVRRDKFKP